MRVYIVVADYCHGERLVEVYFERVDAIERRKALLKEDKLKYVSVFEREVE